MSGTFKYLALVEYLTKSRREGAGLRAVSIGLALRLTDHGDDYAVVVHDGMGIVGQEQEHHRHLGANAAEAIISRILQRAKDYCRARGLQVSLFAVAGPLDEPLALAPPSIEVDRDAKPSFLSRIWLELDAVPFVINCRNTRFSIAGEASAAVEAALSCLQPTTTNIIQASCSKATREVEVDGVGQVHLYDLSQQAALTSPALWETFSALASPIKQYKTRISFFSATPQGGGVALMRHALIRVWSTSSLVWV